jgi:murein L,D-transpeptidase YcbB/YkuD
VYLHDTPAIGLFARANRALSHGCVRVQATRELARWLLEGQPEGEPEAVLAVLAGPATRRVPLVRPAHVFLVYLTAMVWPGGAVHFAPDLYKLEDLPLDAGPTGGQSCVSETGSMPGTTSPGG